MKRTQSKVTSGKQALIAWAKNSCKAYSNVKIEDLSMSWRDGIAFLALLHHFLGQDIVGDISELKPHTNERENLDRAFKIAEKYNIEQFMSTDDILFGKKPEPLSMETQVIQFYQYFKDKKPFGGESDEPQELEEEKTIKRVTSFTGDALGKLSAEERKLKTMSFDGRNHESLSEENTPKIKVSVRRPGLQRTISMMEDNFKEEPNKDKLIQLEEEMVKKKLAEKKKEEEIKKQEEKKKQEQEAEEERKRKEQEAEIKRLEDEKKKEQERLEKEAEIKRIEEERMKMLEQERIRKEEQDKIDQEKKQAEIKRKEDEMKREAEEKRKIEEQEKMETQRKQQQEEVRKQEESKRAQDELDKKEETKRKMEEREREEKLKEELNNMEIKKNVEMKEVNITGNPEPKKAGDEEELTEEQKKAIEQFNETQPGCASCIIL